MKTHTFANVIIQDLSSSAHLRESFDNNPIISKIVDDWADDVYVIPRKALQIHREEQPKYFSM